jgi:hypothetical protein
MFDFEQIVIWGYKIRNLNSFVHTHAWIHQGFYQGFQKLGYKTYWFDDKDTPNIDFKKTLFLTMGDKENTKMPCRPDCFYVFHNSNIPPFFEKGVDKNKFMVIQVYTHDCKTRKLSRVFENDPFQLYNPDGRILYFPWATDIFPEDIKKNINNIKKFKTRNVINFVGMIIEPWGHFARFAKKYGIFFTKIGGYDKRKVSKDDNQRLIQESFMAPALQCKFQVDKGYIPCRIFKNISYGKFGITNSQTVNEYFNHELIYHNDPQKLFLKAYNNIKNHNLNYTLLQKHMQWIADNHTYLNRCQTILNIFEKIIMKDFTSS